VLIREGADKEKAMSNGATPLFVACIKHKGFDVEVVRLLIREAGAVTRRKR
jgi:hypothetical protein